LSQLGEMLAAWRWTGGLAPVLQCTHGPISAETAVELARGHGIDLGLAGASWMPSEQTWATAPWYLVTVRLSSRIGAVAGRERMLIAPRSASLELVGTMLVEIGRQLVVEDVVEIECTFSTATRPAQSWLAADVRPGPRLYAEPAAVECNMQWSGPR
jgi:hypothetical protein